MKTIHSIILIILLSLVCSCGTETRRYHLTGIDKTMIPYQVGDTVRYINDKGTLGTLVVSEIQDEWISGEEDEFTGKLLDLTEYRKVFLRSEAGEAVFVQVGGEGGSRRVLYAVGLNSHSTLRYAVLYNSKGDFIEGVEWDNEFFADKYYTYDKILINNNFYYNVAMYYGRNRQDTIQFYYSKTHGILQMKEKGKDLFTLDTVIFAGER